MRKILLATLTVMLIVSLALCIYACGPDEPSEKTITGITFTDKTVDYNGQEQELTISGPLPEGTSVAYAGNKGTNAGTYQATATISGEGYKTLTLKDYEVFSRDYLFQKDGKYKGYPLRTHAGGEWLDGYSDHLPTVIYLAKKQK